MLIFKIKFSFMKSLTNYLRAYRWQDYTTTIII
jgi:hypothetical protein